MWKWHNCRWHIFTVCGNRSSAHSRRSARKHSEIYWRSPIPQLLRTSFRIRGNVVRHINSSVLIRLVQCLLINPPRRTVVDLFIKYQSPVRHRDFHSGNSSAPKCHSATRLYSVAQYRSDHILQSVYLAPDITCTLLYELRTMLLMEIYIHCGRCGNVAGTNGLDGYVNVRKACLFVQKWNQCVEERKEKEYRKNLIRFFGT